MHGVFGRSRDLAEQPRPVTVIADEVVSTRPLDPTEDIALRGLARSHLWRGLMQPLILAGCFIGALAWWIAGPGAGRIVVPLLIAGPLVGGARAWLENLRKARLMWRDRALGQVLVLESPRGR